MKKFLSLLALALLLTSTMATVVFAQEPDKSVEIHSSEFTARGDLVNMDYVNAGDIVALKPTGDGNSTTTWYEYKVTVPEDCAKLDFVFHCAADGDNRWMDFSIDGKTYTIHCEDTHTWDDFVDNTYTVENVKKGEYVVRIACPVTYDNSTVKTPNMRHFTVNMFYDTAKTPDTVAPETVPEVTVTAPQTFDFGVVAMVAAVVSAAGYALTKKK